MTTAPNGEWRRQDLHVQQLVSLRSLLRVPLGLLPDRKIQGHPDHRQEQHDQGP
jgi:hypothetical protein